jgi:hypothetical protein
MNTAISLCQSIIAHATDAMLRMPDGAEREFFHGEKSAARTIMAELQREPQPPHPAPSPSEVGPEVVERCIDLCEAVIAQKPFVRHPDGPGIIYEARDLLPLLKALLPEPVDADLVEARELEATAAEANGFEEYARNIRAGEYDDDGPVRCTLNGIKRGRALEKEAGR